MIKKLTAAAVGTLLLGTALSAGVVSTADASSTQKLCSSKHSTELIYFTIKSNGYHYLIPRGDCSIRVPKGGVVMTMVSSYRVGYGGDYSKCRSNTNFTPYTKADTIYFRTYSKKNC